MRGELRPQSQRLSKSVLEFFSKNRDPLNLTVALNFNRRAFFRRDCEQANMVNNVKIPKPAAACVRCKAQSQGAKKCREEKRHNETDHPGTTLSNAMCKALMEFRGKEYPQLDLTADQRLLEQV